MLIFFPVPVASEKPLSPYLLAKGLNCETGITATPCGVCDNCREIEQGRFVDLIEIDAASRTKVERYPRPAG